MRILGGTPKREFLGSRVVLRHRRARLHRRRQQTLLDNRIRYNYSGIRENGVAGLFVAHHPAKGDVVFDIIKQLRRARLGGLFRVDDGRQLLIFDHDGISGVLRQIAVFGQHNGNAIANIAHFPLGQRRVFWGFEIAVGDKPGRRNRRQVDVIASKYGQHAVHRFGG